MFKGTIKLANNIDKVEWSISSNGIQAECGGILNILFKILFVKSPSKAPLAITKYKNIVSDKIRLKSK